MTEPQPLPMLACTLTGPEQAQRAQWFARLRTRASSFQHRPDGITVGFPSSDDLESELRTLAAAEAECCAFLTIEVARDEHALTLSVTAPPEGRGIIELMFESAS